MESQTTISVSIRLKHGEVCINLDLGLSKKSFVCVKRSIDPGQHCRQRGPVECSWAIDQYPGLVAECNQSTKDLIANPRRIIVYIQSERTQDLNDNQHLKGLNSPPQISGSVRAGPQPKDLAKSLPVPCCSVKLHKRHWFEVFLQRVLCHQEKQQCSHFWDPF